VRLRRSLVAQPFRAVFAVLKTTSRVSRVPGMVARSHGGRLEANVKCGMIGPRILMPRTTIKASAAVLAVLPGAHQLRKPGGF